MNRTQASPETILDFWFQKISPRQWWVKSEDFDRIIEARFGEVLHAAARCELYGWRETARGRLAEIIALFLSKILSARRITRGLGRAFGQIERIA